MGDYLHEPIRRAQRRHPINRPLHPTQLYEAGAELLILVFLIATERKGRPFPGRTFWGYMLLYGISRFIIEFYRGDVRGTIGTFSTSQFVSLLIVPISIIMLFILGRRPQPAPHAAAPGARPDERSMVPPEDALVVEEEHDGLRLDHFLTSVLHGQRVRRSSGSSRMAA